MTTETQWYIVGPISERMRGLLLTAKRQLTTRNAAITADLNQVAELLGEAVVAFEKDDLPKSRELLKEACDLEYETICECEASGEVSEELFPDGSVDEPQANGPIRFCAEQPVEIFVDDSAQLSVYADVIRAELRRSTKTEQAIAETEACLVRLLTLAQRAADAGLATENLT